MLWVMAVFDGSVWTLAWSTLGLIYWIFHMARSSHTGAQGPILPYDATPKQFSCTGQYTLVPPSPYPHFTPIELTLLPYFIAIITALTRYDLWAWPSDYVCRCLLTVECLLSYVFILELEKSRCEGSFLLYNTTLLNRDARTRARARQMETVD